MLQDPVSCCPKQPLFFSSCSFAFARLKTAYMYIKFKLTLALSLRLRFFVALGCDVLWDVACLADAARDVARQTSLPEFLSLQFFVVRE